jgi:hypothetical protein
MISDPAIDPLLRALRSLPSAAPGADRAARVRARCHTRLARIARKRSSTRDRSLPFVLGQALLGGLCALYFAAVIHDALTLRGFLN